MVLRCLPPTVLSAAVRGVCDVLLCVLQGAYRDDNGRPVVLESVREAERRVAGSNFME